MFKGIILIYTWQTEKSYSIQLPCIQ